MNRYIALFTVIVFSLTTIFTYGYSSNLTDAKNKLNSIKQKKQQTINKIIKTKKQQQYIQQEIKQIDQQMSLTQKELIDNQQKLYFLQKKIDKTQKELLEVQNKYDKRKDLYKDRIRAIYMSGKGGYLEVLFDSKSFSDFLSRLEFVNKLMSFDIRILNEMQKTRNEIAYKEKSLKVQKNNIAFVQSQIEERKKRLQVAMVSRSGVLRDLQRQQKEYEEDLEGLESASRQVEAIIKNGQKYDTSASNDKYSGGKFAWPVPGFYSISSPYGYRIHPVYKTKKLHTGIDIPAPYGSTGVAVGDGTVIFTGWISGYGNSVIIDNGGGISTLYAHNSSILVSNGQKVNKGDPVVKLGQSGLVTGVNLHFEIRINGMPVNPVPYLSR